MSPPGSKNGDNATREPKKSSKTSAIKETRENRKSSVGLNKGKVSDSVPPPAPEPPPAADSGPSPDAPKGPSAEPAAKTAAKPATKPSKQPSKQPSHSARLSHHQEIDRGDDRTSQASTARSLRSVRSQSRSSNVSSKPNRSDRRLMRPANNGGLIESWPLICLGRGLKSVSLAPDGRWENCRRICRRRSDHERSGSA